MPTKTPEPIIGKDGEVREITMDDLKHAARGRSTDEDESYPADLVKRIIDGESPVRVFREYRDLSQSALAEASGVNRVQIADIEAGRKTGSVTTLRKLAAALGVDLDVIA